MNLFKPAVKTEAKLRLAIAGPSGSGKTYSALAVGTALANGGKVAVVDTEHGSASKYADLFSFDVLHLGAPFHPDRFTEAITAAANAGYDVVVLDSLSHAWNGPGGLLEIVDSIAKRMRTANTFAAWKDATPIQNALIEAIVGARVHIIATMRSKQDYIQDVDDRGKTRIRKVGMAPVQREGFEYEFDVFLDMDIENNALVSKTRCPALTGRVISKPGADLAATLREWLSGEPAPPQSPRTAVRDESTTPAPESGVAAKNGGNGGNSDPRRETSPQAQAAREHLRPTAENSGPDWNNIALKAKTFSQFCSAASHLFADAFQGYEKGVRELLEGQPSFVYDPANNEELLTWINDTQMGRVN